ncbi:type I DNA topoisomerase, partial [candidate division KSB1 bacterium]
IATVGHIKNLPKNKIGVDIKKDFNPEYVTIEGKEEVINKLKKISRNKDKIFIATDPDREGEAIAWHISEEIKSKENSRSIKRVLFNEITKDGILEGIKKPKEIDQKRVSAQQARRVMDRLVGYKVSPFLWKTIHSGLSAGRVQSVALRLISEREEVINAFVPEEYWSITAVLREENIDSFSSELFKIKGKDFKIPDKKSVKGHIKNIEKGKFVVRDVRKRNVKRNPSSPFITSTLQQEASNRFGMSTSKIMLLAQQLYEGIEITKKERAGLITYMRTDSTRISDKAVEDVRNYIYNSYGKEYLPDKPRVFKRGVKKIQDAHEAIRPTSFSLLPSKVKKYLNNDQFKLYELIWNRFVACQMSEAIVEQNQADIECGDYLFRTTVSVITFAGFLQVYEEFRENNSEDVQVKIPVGLKRGMELDLVKITDKQHFTKPPPKYTESSLVKALDSNGIGRPSTYSIIISNIIQRKYIEKRERKLHPTELGLTVNKILIRSFPEIFNVEFTSNMEDKLDKIEAGKKNSVKILKDFYNPFEVLLKNVNSKRAEIKNELEERTGEKCEVCGSEMIIKWGRHGKFYACSGYPRCKNTKPLEQKKTESVDASLKDVNSESPEIKNDMTERTEEKCEVCGSEMVVKWGRHGKFYACSEYPRCKNTKPLEKKKTEPVDEKCPKCSSNLIKKDGRYGEFFACSNYPKCKFTRPVKVFKPVEVGEKCPKCDSPLVIKMGRYGKFLACSNYPKCKYIGKFKLGVKCPREGCDGDVVKKLSKKKKSFYGCSNYPKCDFVSWYPIEKKSCQNCGNSYLEIRENSEKEEYRKCPKCGEEF